MCSCGSGGDSGLALEEKCSKKIEWFMVNFASMAMFVGLNLSYEKFYRKKI